MEIIKEKWGTVDKRDVYLFKLVHKNGSEVAVSNYGGIIQSFKVVTKSGKPKDIVLGYDTLNEYVNDKNMFGATIGPIADRVKDACFSLAGNTVFLEQNSGKDCLHSGNSGFQKTVWDYKTQNSKLILYRKFTNNNWLLPGNAEFFITFDFCNSNALKITYSGKCDNFTAFCITNHSYFSLNGGKRDVLDDMLYVNSDKYAETKGECPTCTGKLCNVKNTCFDFKAGKKVLSAVNDNCNEITAAGGIDHYFAVNGEGMREQARLICSDNESELICRSDMPGLLIYTANGLDGVKGKNKSTYKKHYGICFETGFMPNGVNLKEVKDQIIIPPNTDFKSTTEYLIVANN